MSRRRNRLSPRAVAADCLRRAWDDEVDDRSRVLLERASLIIDGLCDRVGSNAKCLEVVEAELASRRWPLLGDDDPGAAL
jgi:hypothetical protein